MDVQPAAVSLSRGRLMIIGHGSDLAQILHSLAAKTGMVFEGASPHARIFGSYGPGAPREVLTQLLGDTGSNFVMTGNMAPGAPLRIMLSPQSKAPPDAPTAPQRRVPVASDNPPTGPPPVHLGPGALAHVPPDELPADQQDRQQRMREHVQRLEQMHQLYQRESENNLP